MHLPDVLKKKFSQECSSSRSALQATVGSKMTLWLAMLGCAAKVSKISLSYMYYLLLEACGQIIAWPQAFGLILHTHQLFNEVHDNYLPEPYI